MKINFKKPFPFNWERLLKFIMKTFLFLCFTTALSFTPNNTFSQNAKIFIEADKEISVSQIFELIQEQAGYKFVYSDELITNAPKVRLKKGTIRAKELLKKGLYPIGCTFEFTENETVIVKKENRPIAKKTPQVSITGTVNDHNGQPLPGANVVEKGTTNGTQTDFDGNYSITVSGDNATLVFSYLGFTTKEVVVDNQTQIDVQLLQDSAKLDEVVVIGYGTQSRRKVTSAISSANAEDLLDQPITSFEQGLAARLPGVDIAQGNGAPGGGINVNIRGVSTITSGTSPLFVVDGVPLSNTLNDRFSQGQATDASFDSEYSLNPLSTINPSDIESIEVLKDAAAAAIYGSRGSNGVVLITTKKGAYGQAPKVSFNSYVGVQSLANKVDVMNAQEFADYTQLSRGLSWVNKDPLNNSITDPNEVRVAGDRVAPYILPYLDDNSSGLPDTDWQDEVYRNALIQNHELSVSGGTEKARYFVSGNYFDQEGIFINSGLERYSARANVDVSLSKRLRFGININPSHSEHKIVNSERNWWKEGLTILTLMAHPNISPRNADGSLRLGEMLQANQDGFVVALIENPLAVALLTENTLTHTRLLGNSYVEFDITDNLTFKTSIGTDLNFYDRFYYRPKELNWRGEPAPTSNANYAWNNRSTSTNWLSENTLTYDKVFGNHNLNVLLGYTAQKERQEQNYVEGRNFPNDNVRTLNSALATNGFSVDRESSIISYLGRISYSYDDKYLLSTAVRRDGSSRFSQDSKWGVFPSVSAGWRVSSEPFLSNAKAINDLKLRASYGLTGNFNIPFYGGTSLLSEANYPLDGQVTTGLAPITAPNDELSWETTATIDFGIDLTLFDNKLTLTADYYKSKTTDLLLNVTVPSTTGFTNSLQNIGELENQGFELSLGTSQRFGQFTWDGNVNFSINKNEVLSLAPGQDQFLANAGLNDPAFIVKVGESIGSFYGYRISGIFESQEQFDSTPNLGGNQGVGDFIYEDTDGDGDVDPDDRVVLGNANPDFVWGFNSRLVYKGFDLSFNLQGKHGVERFNAMHRYLAETWGNNLSVYLNDNAPRPVWGVGTSSHTRPSSWHVEDASFIRMRNITFGYSFPEKILSDNFFGGGVISGLRLYASALNLFTITDYSGYNPEVSSNGGDAITAGEEFGNYPIAKTFTFGINVTF